MENTYLLAVDGSEGSQRAAEFAASQAVAGSAKVIVAYVIEWSPYSFHTPEELAERHKRREEELERARSSILEPVAQSLKDKGVEVDIFVHHGHPSETFIKLAQEKGASQIYVCRKGQSRLASLLFGSVAGALVQTSPIPVIVVP